MKNKILLFYPKFTLLNYVIITESIFLPHYLFLKPAIYFYCNPNIVGQKMSHQRKSAQFRQIFFF